jgi:septation ring formation regulator EzrA
MSKFLEDQNGKITTVNQELADLWAAVHTIGHQLGTIMQVLRAKLGVTNEEFLKADEEFRAEYAKFQAAEALKEANDKDGA